MLPSSVPSIVKFSLVGPAKTIDRYKNQIIKQVGDRYSCFRTSENYFEICKKGNTKGTALKHIRCLYKEIVTISIGDQENDIPMFSEADYSFAVSNASTLVKLQAGRVVDNNKFIGVSRAILECIDVLVPKSGN